MCYFFFQAEDGIRDYKVTGVQTCALPICPGSPERPDRDRERLPRRLPPRASTGGASATAGPPHPLAGGGSRRFQRRDPRSEERRVGKEGGTGWQTDE